MEVDMREQAPPVPMVSPNVIPTNDNHNDYPQTQQSQSQQHQIPTPMMPQTQPQPQPQPQTAYQKHQPLLDQSGPMSPEFGESPTVGFSGGQPTDGLSAPFNVESYSSLSKATKTINMRYQLFLDKISPHWKARWAFSLIALVVFMARVVIAQGWYVICYALAIYYLNLLIGFISPKVDPGMGLNDDDELGDPMLPTHANDEFRPFIRRLPEFKFWISGTKATLISLFLSLFDMFDVPVFWPILLIYFVILFACTMRQQIQHMIRYSYVPWDSGKKKYTGKTNESPANLYPRTV